MEKPSKDPQVQPSESQDPGLLGLSMDELAGVSVDELTGNKTAIENVSLGLLTRNPHLSNRIDTDDFLLWLGAEV